jgi:hypothetical protein
MPNAAILSSEIKLIYFTANRFAAFLDMYSSGLSLLINVHSGSAVGITYNGGIE